MQDSLVLRKIPCPSFSCRKIFDLGWSPPIFPTAGIPSNSKPIIQSKYVLVFQQPQQKPKQSTKSRGSSRSDFHGEQWPFLSWQVDLCNFNIKSYPAQLLACVLLYISRSYTKKLQTNNVESFLVPRTLVNVKCSFIYHKKSSQRPLGLEGLWPGDHAFTHLLTCSCRRVMNGSGHSLCLYGAYKLVEIQGYCFTVYSIFVLLVFFS